MGVPFSRVAPLAALLPLIPAMGACALSTPTKTESASRPPATEKTAKGRAVEGRVPPPRPEFVHPTRDLATETRALEADGFTSGPAIPRTLDAFEPIPLPAEKDVRYAVLLRLEPGAAFSPRVQGYGLRSTIRGGIETCSPGAVEGGAIVTTCAGVDLLAIDASKALHLHFSADDGARAHHAPDQPEALGTGQATAYVYARPATKEDSARWREQMNAFIGAHSPAARGAQACRACRKAYDECRVTAGHPDCVATYARCLPETADRKQPTWQICGQPAP
jgi:hypothetical protein